MSIPVTVLGGYLGSGKTTLVNQLLRKANGLRLAILVNDFGELAIDADLIEADDGDIISLAGGCVCCSYGDDLSSALLDVQSQSSQPDHIVVEASGVALPGAIGSILSLLRGLTLEGIVVLADASRLLQTASDKYLSDTIARQLKAADLVLLNKCDLVSDATLCELHVWFSEHYPSVRVIDAVQADLPNELVLGNVGPTTDLAVNASGRSSLNDVEHFVHDSELFDSIEIHVDESLDVAKLARQLSEPECALFRAKGFVRDLNGEVKTIQVVGNRWTVSPAPDKAQTGLVCIGKRGDFSESLVRRYCDLVSS